VIAADASDDYDYWRRVGKDIQQIYPHEPSEVESDIFRSAGILKRLSMQNHSLQFYAPVDEHKQLNSAAFIQGYLGVNVGLNSVRGHMVH